MSLGSIVVSLPLWNPEGGVWGSVLVEPWSSLKKNVPISIRSPEIVGGSGDVCGRQK